MRRVLAGCLLIAGSNAFAESPRLADEELRRFVAGKTVHLDTKIGTIPITYNEDGTLTGKVASLPLRAYLGSETDRGRWQVKGDKICQKFFRWLSGETACVAFRQEGRRISWRRDDGMTGTATIAANDAQPPPPPMGSGLRTEPPAPPPAAMAGATPSAAAMIARMSAAASAGLATPAAAQADPAPTRDIIEPETFPSLIEPPTRVSLQRPPMLRAALTFAKPHPVAAAVPALPPSAPMSASPFDQATRYSSDTLKALARSLAHVQAGQDWCRKATTAAAGPHTGEPPLMVAARGGAASETASQPACMMAQPALMDVSRRTLFDLAPVGAR